MFFARHYSEDLEFQQEVSAPDKSTLADAFIDEIWDDIKSGDVVAFVWSQTQGDEKEMKPPKRIAEVLDAGPGQ